ncbi:MAG: ABC transporter ATP-binding protein/permease [Alistipes sp.]|uniref:ATP-binding cassette domain-containing protein n=1 Tax=Alistipes sp. TaxID=1872444 RepID=UPI0025BF4AFE|nr:ABC transporter ATP-binding protein [Alistipes sp.]MCD8275031.1 ABC transporter ATP-binding protein/permease [Alistipes sp.]
MNEIIGIIPSKFRRRGFGVACTLLLRAGLNFLGLAVLLPVLALVLDAGSLTEGGPLARVYATLGFTSPRSFALAVCTAVVAVIVLKCLINLWLARVERNYIYDLYCTLSRRLYVTYHDRGLPFVKSSNSAVLARNVNVVCLAFTAGVLKPAAAIAAEAMLLALLFGALLWYAPVAAVLAVAVFLPSVWIYYGLVRNRINRYGELENKAQREKARLVAETFRGYADIEINNAFPMMLRSFDRAMDQVIRTRLRETAIGMLPQTFTEIGLALGMALLVALSLGAEEGRAQLLFGVFAVAALRLMPSVRNIMAGWTSIKYNRYTIDILRDATAEDKSSSASPDTLSDAAERAGKGPHTDAAAIPSSEYSAAESDETACGRRTAPYGQTAPAQRPGTSEPTESGSNDSASGPCAPEQLPFEREIAVHDLGFRFADDGHELFRGLTLSIRKGERIGIRGASGAGKTTLFNLLLGLYEPTGGEITIDGTPLTSANRRAWQNRIGYVSQSLFIADGSFAANVALGVPDGEIDRGRVAEALEAARLGEFVSGLAKGMDTHVGECGCRLSGGQRQRIGIARALYRRADVLFFDEATSALDSRTEEEINRSIAELAAHDKGLTLVVIAHRESSLEYCTRIITIGE